MQISNSGLQKIIAREGVKLHAYKDSVGVWTIGTGHTSAAGLPRVTPDLVITQAQNSQILRQDLAPIERQAAQYIKVPITQNQYDAIISIVFNVGPRFWQSVTIKKLNQGDVKGAAEAIMQWSKPPEIIGRRRSEQQQFLTPDSSLTHVSTGTGVVATAAGGVVAAHSNPHIWYWIIGATAIIIIGLVAYSLYSFIKKGKINVS